MIIEQLKKSLNAQAILHQEEARHHGMHARMLVIYQCGEPFIVQAQQEAANAATFARYYLSQLIELGI